MSALSIEAAEWPARQLAVELDAKATRKEARNRQAAELSRLTKFINNGGELVAEELQGFGVIYRSRARTAAPFSAELVELWLSREALKQARAEKRAAKEASQ